jgi:DNA topoisomerase-1
MSKDLIIVESPAKVKTIKKFLGRNYEVAASVGHVRDLPKKDFGVDEDRGFAPRYEIIEGKEEVVRKLRAAAAKADTVYLAPDPDREGEAIAWHVAQAIRDKNQNIRRIRFNEITARAVKEALEQPKEIDERLFNSQQARRILDRLVGYKLSPLLWKKVKRGISAGRVQSVALKLVVEREKERQRFVSQEYWVFKAHLAADAPPAFTVELWKVEGKKPAIGSADEAAALEAAIAGQPFTVAEVEEKERKKAPLPPFITSTLQQDANRRLGFSAKKTMTLAQRLYEGVELGEAGTTALITYMRTDSVRIADEARQAAREFIGKNFGEDHLPAKPRVFKSKGSAQDAHEAVRPVDPALTPRETKGHLPADLQKLYTLIWERFTASQMADALFHDTLVTVASGPALWRVKGERLLFPGFLKVYGRSEEEESAELPALTAGQTLTLTKLDKEQKFTQPPARYTEATLVKELEDKGIGRPSTYAAILSTIQDREYVRLEERKFVPSELGCTVSDQLSGHFTELMDVGFTAQMEDRLDEVAEGRQDWVALLTDFSKGFGEALDKAQEGMTRGGQATDIRCALCGKPMQIKFSKSGGEFLGCTGFPDCKNILNFTRTETGEIKATEKVEEKTDISCDKCGKPMLVKRSRMGDFLGCSGYPECKNIKNFVRDADGAIKIQEAAAPEVVGKCPDCGGDLVLKRAKTGSRFIACLNYPKCKHTEPFSTGVPCPVEGCGGMLMEKSSGKGKLFYSCGRYPQCKFALWNWPVPGTCPQCGSKILVRKTVKGRGEVVACPEKGCGYIQEPEE